MSNSTFAKGDRAQFFGGMRGFVERVLNGGAVVVFQADTGARFTVRADELSAVDAPVRVAPAVPKDGRIVFRMDPPKGIPTARPKQATPSQQQQGRAPKRYSDLTTLTVDGVEIAREHDAIGRFCIQARVLARKGRTCIVETIADGDLKPFGFHYSVTPDTVPPLPAGFPYGFATSEDQQPTPCQQQQGRAPSPVDLPDIAAQTWDQSGAFILSDGKVVADFNPARYSKQPLDEVATIVARARLGAAVPGMVGALRAALRFSASVDSGDAEIVATQIRAVLNDAGVSP